MHARIGRQKRKIKDSLIINDEYLKLPKEITRKMDISDFHLSVIKIQSVIANNFKI